MKATITRDQFDAALVPGFREATSSEYRSLDKAWGQTSSTTLDKKGEFLSAAGMERDCPLCRASREEATLNFIKLGMHIVTCKHCGLTYSRNILRPEFDRQLYVHSASQNSYFDLKRNDAYAAIEKIKCQYIVQRIGTYQAPPGQFLDVGAGAGRLLWAAKQSGWNTFGIEANAEFAKACHALQVPVVHGFFPESLPAGQRYDVITIIDVLEHLSDPVDFLKTSLDWLSESGLVVIQVPNMDSLIVQLEGSSNTNYCHGHWNHFNTNTLEKLAVEAGLEPLAVETIISEIDRIRAFPQDAITQKITQYTGLIPPRDFDAEWLHAHGLGYKVLGFFRRKNHVHV